MKSPTYRALKIKNYEHINISGELFAGFMLFFYDENTGQDFFFFSVLVFVVLKSSKGLNKNNKDQDASLKKKSLYK